jgi:thioredoxin 1
MVIDETSLVEQVSKGLTLLDFYASWCQPCRVLTPIIDAIKESNTGVRVIKINVDDNPVLAKRFNVRGIPMLVYMNNGKILETSIGVSSRDGIQSLIDKYSGKQED